MEVQPFASEHRSGVHHPYPLRPLSTRRRGALIGYRGVNRLFIHTRYVLSQLGGAVRMVYSSIYYSKGFKMVYNMVYNMVCQDLCLSGLVKGVEEGVYACSPTPAVQRQPSQH